MGGGGGQAAPDASTDEFYEGFDDAVDKVGLKCPPPPAPALPPARRAGAEEARRMRRARGVGDVFRSRTDPTSD